MKNCVVSVAALSAMTASLGTFSAANAAFLPDGEYFLLNHPAAFQTPPPYGLRLDELYDATPGDDGFDPTGTFPEPNHDVFTFNFEAAGSDMRIQVSGSTIRIYGVSYGGRDTGAGYAADAYLGFYTIDFTYNVGVATVPGDDDRWIEGQADYVNIGTITTPLGDTIDLGDKNAMGPQVYSFRLGDEDADAGHRGAAGFSGWGWVSHGDQPFNHVDYSDWLFLVGEPTPAPGTVACMLAGAGLVVSRRRRV